MFFVESLTWYGKVGMFALVGRWGIFWGPTKKQRKSINRRRKKNDWINGNGNFQGVENMALDGRQVALEFPIIQKGSTEVKAVLIYLK